MNRDPRIFPPRRVPGWELPPTTDRVMNAILSLQRQVSELSGDLDDARSEVQDLRDELQRLDRAQDEHDTRITDLENPS